MNFFAYKIKLVVLLCIFRNSSIILEAFSSVIYGTRGGGTEASSRLTKTLFAIV